MSDLAALQGRDESLRATANGFCNAFVAGTPPTEILDKFFTSSARITEHGPSWAKDHLPFLSTTFSGRRHLDTVGATHGTTCDDYYDLLASTLSFHPTDETVPPQEEFLVAINKNLDGEWESAVTIKLHAKFSSVKTGKSWQENFVYVLSDFDRDMKIGCLELWADPLSAWMALMD